jgi:hypothetical protein
MSLFRNHRLRFSNNLLFRERFATGIPSHEIWKEWDLGLPHIDPRETPWTSPNVVIVDAPGLAGEKAWQLTIAPGQGTTDSDLSIGKDRAQLRWQPTADQFAAGKELWHGMRVRIPSGYVYNSDGTENFNILDQWHDQIFEYSGATPGNQPVCSFEYEQVGGVTPRFKLNYGCNDAPVNDPRQSAALVVQRDRWYDVVLGFNWSKNSDGWVKAYLDGQFLLQFNGKNLYPDQGPLPNYRATGIYRARNLATTNTLYLTDIRCARTREGLALAI